MMLPLDERSPHAVLARRELVLAAVILVAFTRLVEPADAFLISGLLPVVMLLAGIGVLGSDRNRRPFENLLVPAVLTGGAGAAIHQRSDAEYTKKMCRAMTAGVSREAIFFSCCARSTSASMPSIRRLRMPRKVAACLPLE